MAFVDVLLPERATPIHPSMGARTMKNGSIFESPNASELAIPVKTKMYAIANTKAATNSAPHICLKVRMKTSFTIAPPGLRIARIISQDAIVDDPPPNGVKLKSDVMGFWVIEDVATTDHLNKLTAGRCDHG